jgi:hypothetical protein
MRSSREDQPASVPPAFVRNWRQPMPLGKKVRLTVRNLTIKFAKRQTCCGHPGEPGC